MVIDNAMMINDSTELIKGLVTLAWASWEWYHGNSIGNKEAMMINDTTLMKYGL